jgi:hypothetical protein
MLLKIFKAVNVLMAFAAIVGDEKLMEWDKQVRLAIRRFSDLAWIRRAAAGIFDWLKWLFHWIFSNKQLFAGFLTVVLVIGGILGILGGCFAEGQNQLLLYEAQKADPEGTARVQWICIGSSLALMLALLAAEPLGLYLRRHAEWLYDLASAVWSGIITLIRWVIYAMFAVSATVIFGSVAIVLGLLMASPLLVILAGILIILLFLGMLLLVLRIALLPFLLLDKVTERLKLRGAIFLIAALSELAAFILEEF